MTTDAVPRTSEPFDPADVTWTPVSTAVDRSAPDGHRVRAGPAPDRDRGRSPSWSTRPGSGCSRPRSSRSVPGSRGWSRVRSARSRTPSVRTTCWSVAGIVFRQLVVVPYGRMQYVDVNAGPLARRFRIASVQLHTASPGHERVDRGSAAARGRAPARPDGVARRGTAGGAVSQLQLTRRGDRGRRGRHRLAPDAPGHAGPQGLEGAGGSARRRLVPGGREPRPGPRPALRAGVPAVHRRDRAGRADRLRLLRRRVAGDPVRGHRRGRPPAHRHPVPAAAAGTARPPAGGRRGAAAARAAGRPGRAQARGRRRQRVGGVARVPAGGRGRGAACRAARARGRAAAARSGTGGSRGDHDGRRDDRGPHRAAGRGAVLRGGARAAGVRAADGPTDQATLRVGAVPMLVLVMVAAAGTSIASRDIGAAFFLLAPLFGGVTYVWSRINQGANFRAAISPDGIRLRHGLTEARAQTVPTGPRAGHPAAAGAAVARAGLVARRDQRGRLRPVRQPAAGHRAAPGGHARRGDDGPVARAAGPRRRGPDGAGRGRHDRQGLRRRLHPGAAACAVGRPGRLAAARRPGDRARPGDPLGTHLAQRRRGAARAHAVARPGAGADPASARPGLVRPALDARARGAARAAPRRGRRGGASRRAGRARADRACERDTGAVDARSGRSHGAARTRPDDRARWTRARSVAPGAGRRAAGADRPGRGCGRGRRGRPADHPGAGA